MIKSFAGYTFPKTVDSQSENFKDALTQTMRAPGLSGGINEDGVGPLPRSVGRVTVDFTLMVDNTEDMQALRDEVNALASVGLGLLVDEQDDGDADRYTWAFVNFITMNESEDASSLFWQSVKIIFHVPDPRWLINTNGLAYAGGGGTAGSGLTAGEGSVSHAVSGLTTTFTRNHPGNGITIPQIGINCGVGQTCENPVIQRIKNGAAVDEIRYVGVLEAGDWLIYDGNRKLAELNAVDCWDNLDYIDPDLLRLEAGDNSIKVMFANSGDAATIYFWYLDVYL